MNTLLNMDWSEVLAVPRSMGVVLLMVILIAYVQLRRHRTHRSDRSSARPNMWRSGPPELRSEDRTQEYLENANFSNEGNPHFGWTERFLERSSPNGRHEGHPQSRNTNRPLRNR